MRINEGNHMFWRIRSSSEKGGKVSRIASLESVPLHLRKKAVLMRYCISSVIRGSFSTFQNKPKNVDLSCKMDLDLWDCLRQIKLV